MTRKTTESYGKNANRAQTERSFNPSLTTVRQPLQRMGEIAACTLDLKPIKVNSGKSFSLQPRLNNNRRWLPNIADCRVRLRSR